MIIKSVENTMIPEQLVQQQILLLNHLIPIEHGDESIVVVHEYLYVLGKGNVILNLNQYTVLQLNVVY